MGRRSTSFFVQNAVFSKPESKLTHVSGEPASGWTPQRVFWLPFPPLPPNPAPPQHHHHHNYGSPECHARENRVKKGWSFLCLYFNKTTLPSSFRLIYRARKNCGWANFPNRVFFAAWTAVNSAIGERFSMNLRHRVLLYFCEDEQKCVLLPQNFKVESYTCILGLILACLIRNIYTCLSRYIFALM